MFATDSFMNAEMAYREERARQDWGTRPTRRRRSTTTDKGSNTDDE